MFQCTVQDNRIVFEVNYHTKDRAKSANARWDKDAKHWYYPLDYLVTQDAVSRYLNDLTRAGFTLTQEGQEALECHINTLDRERQALYDFKRDHNAPQPDNFQVELFPYQRAGVQFLESVQNPLLSDDMGVGKTYQAIAWGRKKTPCLIVCPAKVKLDWFRSILAALPTHKVVVLNNKMLDTPPGAAEWYIINYDILGQWLAVITEVWNIQTIMLDEAHYIKDYKSLRTKYALQLSKEIPNKLCITGTPAKNQPHNFFTLFQFLGRVKKEEWWSWRARYCETQTFYKKVSKQNGEDEIKKVSKIVGAKNQQQLHQWMQPFCLRRKRSEVLKDLPPKLYDTKYVELENRKEYDLAEADILSYLYKAGKTPEQVMSAMQAQHLVTMNHLRQIAIQGKIPAVLEYLQELEEQTDRKAIIFSCFEKPLTHNIYPKLRNAVLHTGQQTEAVREAAKQRFQEDPETRWFLSTIQAGGDAITLTAADTVIFLDQPWSPYDKRQAEDRAHRQGQKNNVTIVDFLGDNSIDEDMVAILEKKRQAIDPILDGTVTDDVVLEDGARDIYKHFLTRLGFNGKL